MTKTIGRLADELLETIAKEDERDFHRKGFYTTRTKAGDCQVLTFQWPKEQRKLTDFEIWRKQKMNSNILTRGNTEIWTKEGTWTKDVLDPMGEASFEEIKQAMAENKKLTYRYIVENHYIESIKDAGSKISYSQIFIEGENAGYFEEHPHREYKKLEDGRTIAIGEPTIAYDLIFEYKNIRRVGSVYVWIKAEEKT